MKAFGTHVNPDLERTPVPVGVPCLHCEEAIGTPRFGRLDRQRRPALPPRVFLADDPGQHAHQHKRCTCYGGKEEDDPDLTSHQAARAACIEYMRTARREAPTVICPQCHKRRAIT